MQQFPPKILDYIYYSTLRTTNVQCMHVNSVEMNNLFCSIAPEMLLYMSLSIFNTHKKFQRGSQVIVDLSSIVLETCLLFIFYPFLVILIFPTISPTISHYLFLKFFQEMKSIEILS